MVAYTSHLTWPVLVRVVCIPFPLLFPVPARLVSSALSLPIFEFLLLLSLVLLVAVCGLLGSPELKQSDCDFEEANEERGFA